MSELKKGDGVLVKVGTRTEFTGTIVGESRTGEWWRIIKDGKKWAQDYHKSFCRPMPSPQDRAPLQKDSK